ncbi:MULTISPECIES: glycogen debranching protein GlgX [unclassified Leifsonia]|uniref:glycogen debranching protein GlgX n=1 Tax=unclassified Leifsonia TaxID=2663824 RepID=UPI0008A78F3D|nr:MULTISPECIES: glycogen debranching protein GlgX [unclassified Leifsonia]SEI09138.1 glycogen operon protein [Leifsonia sp. CL154]SFL84277.1 glycogen operon protein [Leifsonia sp. CL147]
MTSTDPLRNLGVRLGPHGGELRVFSANADAMELCLFDETDPNWLVKTVPMTRDANGVWMGRSRSLAVGTRYTVRVSGPAAPGNMFDPEALLLDPYARGLIRVASDGWRSVVVADGFDWGDAHKPATPLDHTVIYEAHVKGISRLNPAVPEELRGSYAGLAHESTIGYLKDLGVTAVELLPVHAFVSEQRLIQEGLTNYWGYNTLNFFTPHTHYASRGAQAAGPAAVLAEFKGMVKLLHLAGIEVILDVVYNHTAEEGIGGPRTSFRGIDNATYYRHDGTGAYIDVTGCGNTLDFGNPVPQRLVLDSLRYWANEMQIDGFRFDLAATLGRGTDASYHRDHPLLVAAQTDPALQGVKLIAEPWDVGLGGWQTGNFPGPTSGTGASQADGWSEWNDRYRDRVRNFWLADISDARRNGQAPVGIGGFATRLAGSSNTFSPERGPLASVNFITAHDGFTMADLTVYDVKHNLGNGENNRDGTDNNRSFNHGVEGPTTDEAILMTRAKAVRNLMGTLLLSAGVPMITAGDEYGRSQRGNNNAYCHDSELTWMGWLRTREQRELYDTTKRLLQLRRDNPALRPSRYAVDGQTTPNASHMDWYDATGQRMDDEDWNSPENRTLQYLAASTPDKEEFNRVLLIVHGVEDDVEVSLPVAPGVTGYRLLWDSATEVPIPEDATEVAPGATRLVGGTSMQLYRAHGPRVEPAVAATGADAAAGTPAAAAHG